MMLVVVLLAGAAWLWMRHERAKRPGVEARPVRCEACGGEYIPRTGAPDEPCPQCGGTKHVVVMWYRCRDCGHTWIGFEQQSDTGLFRRPGGEWVGAAEFDPTQTCPECGSTRASSILRPSAQGE
ncbi:MAG: hypothetical protein JW889_06505 [Verrucomicrobia bacterium]|nr:hypothetical protein [Verrucomicrobiota bacterium]